jgi:hydrogenase maturation protease
MTNGSPDILVLALGNELLSDDAVGLHVLRSLGGPPPGVEYLDGGTKGIELLGAIAGRRRLIILDAVQLGAEPGTVHVLDDDELRRLRARRATTAHEGNALELLAVAELSGDLPERVTVIGIEPGNLRTGLALSPRVAASLPTAGSQVIAAVLHGPTLSSARSI